MRTSDQFCLRLTFFADSSGFRLVDSKRLNMKAYPTDGPLTTDAGWHVELVDASGSSIYTRMLDDPMRFEYPAEDDNALARSATPSATEFSVLVPDYPAATEFVLYGTPADHEGFGPSSELVRLSIGQIKKSSQDGFDTMPNNDTSSNHSNQSKL